MLVITLLSKSRKQVIATGRLALHSILRQGSEKVVKGFKVPLEDPKDHTVVACLHLMIQNAGVFIPVERIKRENRNLQTEGMRKVVSKEKDQIFKIDHSEDESEEDEDDLNNRENANEMNRKMQRMHKIKNFKEESGKLRVVEVREMSPDIKHTVLQEFIHSKSVSRVERINGLLIEAITNRSFVDVRTGEAAFFKIPINNIFDYQEIFEFKLLDSSNSSHKEEVTLIDKEKDLELWAS